MIPPDHNPFAPPESELGESPTRSRDRSTLDRLRDLILAIELFLGAIPVLAMVQLPDPLNAVLFVSSGIFWCLFFIPVVIRSAKLGWSAVFALPAGLFLFLLTGRTFAHGVESLTPLQGAWACLAIVALVVWLRSLILRRSARHPSD